VNFKNGVTDAAMKGIDWTKGDGKPSGYEGYLADSFRFLQAVLLREPAFREKLYRLFGELNFRTFIRPTSHETHCIHHRRLCDRLAGSRERYIHPFA